MATILSKNVLIVCFFILWLSISYKHESSAFLSRGGGSSSSSGSSNSGSGSSNSGSSRSSSNTGGSSSRGSDSSSSSRVREAIRDKYHRIVDKNPSPETSNSRVKEAIKDKYHKIVDHKDTDKDKGKDIKPPAPIPPVQPNPNPNPNLNPPAPGFIGGAGGNLPAKQETPYQQPGGQQYPQQPYPQQPGGGYQQPYPQQPGGYQQPYPQQPYPQQPGGYQQPYPPYQQSGGGVYGGSGYGNQPYSGSGSKSGKLGALAGLAKKILTSGKHRPKGQHQHNYYAGMYNGYNYRPDRYGQVQGYVCKNYLEYDGIVFGEFRCPIEGYNYDETECCGLPNEQYCCTPQEKSFQTGGGGGAYGNDPYRGRNRGISATTIFFAIFIPIFIISLILCGVCIFCCYKKRIYEKVPGFSSS